MINKIVLMPFEALFSKNASRKKKLNENLQTSNDEQAMIAMKKSLDGINTPNAANSNSQCKPVYPYGQIQ